MPSVLSYTNAFLGIPLPLKRMGMIGVPPVIAANLTISRSTPGYAQTSTGNLTSFAANTLRMTDLGLLIEDSRTNLVIQSQDFTTTWGNLSVSVTPNVATAPDSSVTADAFVENTNSTTNITLFNNITSVSATSYAFSVWAKAVSSRYLYLLFSVPTQNFFTAVFDLQAGVVGETKVGTTSGTITSTSIEAYTNGWYRCTLVGSLTGTATTIEVGLASALTGNSFNANGEITTTGTLGTTSFYVWGAQVEQASFASSYIPTTTTSVTRAADAIAFTGTLDSAASGTAVSLVTDVIDNSNGVSNPQIIYPRSGLATVQTMVATQDTVVTSNDSGGNGLSASPTGAQKFSTGAKAAIGWDASSRSLVMAGGTVASDAHVGGLSSGGPQRLGPPGTNTFMYCRHLTVWNSRLSDPTLQSATAAGPAYTTGASVDLDFTQPFPVIDLSYLYPGALQPNVSPPPPSVLTNAEAFLGIQYPQKFSANTKVQSFLYPGALQPAVNSAAVAVAVTGYRNMIFIPRWDQMMWGWNP